MERDETPHDLANPVQIRLPAVLTGDGRAELAGCRRCHLNIVPFGVKLLLVGEECRVSDMGTKMLTSSYQQIQCWDSRGKKDKLKSEGTYR